ncbi:hypothetical protein NEISICOT_01262 [Neisseria sicca ATCC 29256]|uniref:Uncharacterized protein n=1 Tax=Neisseria sicca ATCC 29256 TaxID=547045 RepID=C6M420_NEISI|nr:hypothetical protein NEISICOT_01262 [Neisseria sicca ATCC 29256]
MPHLAVLSALSAASSPCPDLNLIHHITKFDKISKNHSFRRGLRDFKMGGTIA